MILLTPVCLNILSPVSTTRLKQPRHHRASTSDLPTSLESTEKTTESSTKLTDFDSL